MTVPLMSSTEPSIVNTPQPGDTRNVELVISKLLLALTVRLFSTVMTLLPAWLAVLFRKSVCGLNCAPPTIKLLMVMQLLMLLLSTVAGSTVTVAEEIPLLMRFAASSFDGTPSDHWAPFSHLPLNRNHRFVVSAASTQLPASSMETKQMITCRARCLSCRYRAASLKCAKRRDCRRRQRRLVGLGSSKRHEA